MLRFTNCKINIGLYITRKREDGYHDLETVFYPIALKDVLEIVPAAETAIHLHGKTIEGDTHNNLVWKAYQLLLSRYPEKISPIDIHLLKNVPMGAGLGGGSADGAHMLMLMNDYYHLCMSEDELITAALQLGSDCPFFIRNSPQYATGRGELMQLSPVDLSGYSIQLVCPGLHVATAAAFKMITPKPAQFDLKMLANLPVEKWTGRVSNDFEIPVFKMHPELAAIKQQLYDAGALYAAMSGSGSTIYGIFDKDKKPVLNIPAQYTACFLP